MTVKEIYNHISALGYEEPVDGLRSCKWFYSYINLALYELHRLFPEKKVLKLAHYPLPVGIRELGPLEISDSERSLCCSSAACLSFEASGKGSALVEYNGEQELLSWDAKPQAYSRITWSFNGPEGSPLPDIVLTFLPDRFYAVKDIGIYTRRPSDGAVPEISEYVEYDARSLASDFLRFDSAPLREPDGSGPIVPDYRAIGKVLMLPYDASGTYDVYYIRVHTPLLYTSDPREDTSVPDVPRGTEDLLCLLVASYIWKADEPVLSSSYRQMFETLAALRLREYEIPFTSRVKNTNNW